MHALHNDVCDTVSQNDHIELMDKTHMEQNNDAEKLLYYNTYNCNLCACVCVHGIFYA